MSPDLIVHECGRRGIALSVEGGSLRYRCGESTVDRGLLDLLRAYKAPLIALLERRSSPAPAVSGPARHTTEPPDTLETTLSAKECVRANKDVNRSGGPNNGNSIDLNLSQNTQDTLLPREGTSYEAVLRTPQDDSSRVVNAQYGGPHTLGKSASCASDGRKSLVAQAISFATQCENRVVSSVIPTSQSVSGGRRPPWVKLAAQRWGEAVGDRSAGIVMPADHWRWRAANLPPAGWSRWRARVSELAPPGSTAELIHAADRAAYLEVAESIQWGFNGTSAEGTR